MRLVGATSAQPVAVFLAEQARAHGGRETLADLLNDPGAFIPAECLTTGRTLFLHRDAISVARIPLVREPDDPVSFTLPSEHAVEIVLVDGTIVEGLLTYVGPPERSRLVDFLEDAPRFFPITDGDTTHLVNKALVASVTTSERNHGPTRSGN